MSSSSINVSSPSSKSGDSSDNLAGGGGRERRALPPFPCSARRGALGGVGGLHLFNDGVVLGAGHEVPDRDMLRARCPVHRPQRQVLVGHDQVVAVVQV